MPKKYKLNIFKRWTDTETKKKQGLRAMLFILVATCGF